MKALFEWLQDEPKQRIGIRVCQTGIGLTFIYRSITEFPQADFLYGAKGLSDKVFIYYGSTISNF